MKVSFTARPTSQKLVELTKSATNHCNELRDLLEQSQNEWQEICRNRISNVEKLSKIPFVGKILSHFYCAGTALKDLFNFYPTKADKEIRRRKLL